MAQHDRDYLDEKLDFPVPASPTAGSLNDILSKAAGGNTFSKTTDSLEALSDKLGGFSGDGGAAQDDSAKASLDLLNTELAKVPKSDAAVTFNATALASVNAEVDAALNTIVPASPTAGSPNDILSKAAGGNTFSKATDSLEALRDRIDAVKPDVTACTTTGTVVQDGATAAPNVVTVTPSATANTFGSWAALDASASADSWISHVTVTAVIGVNTDWNYCLEIGTGAISSEATKIRFSFKLEKFSDTENAMYTLVFPIVIPIKVASGVRIAARASASGANGAALNVGLSMYQSLET